MESIDLVIASRLELVHLLGLAVRGICQGQPLSGDEADALELAACEAANNAIKHAYKERPDCFVRVTVVVDGTGLVICVQDQGTPMKDQHKLANEMAVVQRVEDLPEGGMGLFLIRSAADSVGYKAGTKNNVLVIRKAFRRN